MGDRLAAFPFGNALEQFAHLEEQHDEHRLRELRLRARKEADGERPEGRDGHQEVLVQRLPVGKRLEGFPDGIPSDNEVRDQVNQEVSPCGPVGSLLDEHRRHQQDRGQDDLDDRLLGAALLMVMMMLVVMMFMVVMVMAVVMIMIVMVPVPVRMLVLMLMAVTGLVVVMVFVYHDCIVFLDTKIHRAACNRVANRSVRAPGWPLPQRRGWRRRCGRLCRGEGPGSRRPGSLRS